jgi:hypothetical protein
MASIDFLTLVPIIVALEKVNFKDPKTFIHVLDAFPADLKNGLVSQAFASAHIDVPAFLGTLPPDIKLQVIQWANKQQAQAGAGNAVVGVGTSPIIGSPIAVGSASLMPPPLPAPVFPPAAETHTGTGLDAPP